MDLRSDPDSLLAVSKQSPVAQPKEKEALNIKGIALMALGQSDEAEEIYQRLLVDHPNFGDAYRNYGLLLRNNGDYEKALAFFNKAALLSPDNPENYIERARCRLETKDLKNSQKELTYALARFPDNADLKHEAAVSCSACPVPMTD